MSMALQPALFVWQVLSANVCAAMCLQGRFGECKDVHYLRDCCFLSCLLCMSLIYTHKFVLVDDSGDEALRFEKYSKLLLGQSAVDVHVTSSSVGRHVRWR